jgi:hypothetical protein
MANLVWDGVEIAKPIYLEDFILYGDEKVYCLDHYLINCPDCGAELTIKLVEHAFLNPPAPVTVQIVHSEHKS